MGFKDGNLTKLILAGAYFFYVICISIYFLNLLTGTIYQGGLIFQIVSIFEIIS